jgi:uncharacterized protein
MEYKIITSEYFNTVCWSGGTTTELYIFPASAEYRQRNFLFRLSTAKVEAEESDFTLLSGISRKLMVLDGKITLNHKDQYSRQLDKFDVDSFDGDCKTSSVGKCTDFNLMTSGKTAGELTALVIEKEQTLNYKNKGFCDWFFIYVFSGKVKIDLDNKITTVSTGDLVIVNKLIGRNFEINSFEKSELVVTEITLG